MPDDEKEIECIKTRLTLLEDNKEAVGKGLQLHLDKLSKLEQKESRNYDNINELRRQISVNDDQLSELEDALQTNLDEDIRVNKINLESHIKLENRINEMEKKFTEGKSLHEVYKRLSERIEKLEDWSNKVPQWFGRIEKLEQSEICITTGIGLISHDIDNLQVEITELEKKYEYYNKTLVSAELLKFLSGFKWDKNTERIKRLEEVLRELGDVIYEARIGDDHKVMTILGKLEKDKDDDSELVIRTVEEEWDRDQKIAKHWQQRINTLKQEFILDLNKCVNTSQYNKLKKKWEEKK